LQPSGFDTRDFQDLNPYSRPTHPHRKAPLSPHLEHLKSQILRAPAPNSALPAKSRDSNPKNSAGIVNNWDDMVHLWDYTFKRMNVENFSERRILLTEPPMNPKRNREKLLEVMFEHYGEPLSIKGCRVQGLGV